MFDRDAITSQVRHNCCISDARYAGFYSLCHLALRLRDLYKWEKGLRPWVEKDTSEISEWIEEKEALWNEVSERSFKEIFIFGKSYDPFDSMAINVEIEPHGLLYGAGYGQSLKPTFFLAVIENKTEIEGHPLYLLGRELARDLSTTPALSQNDCILVRKESALPYLWDKVLFIKKSGSNALKFALERCGLRQWYPKAPHRLLGKLFETELDTYIYHELGEIKDTTFDPTIWKEIIAAFPHTAVELLVRSVKDLLADTNNYGPLKHIARERKTASLALYVAFLDGFSKMLFPELIEAFRIFMKTEDWSSVEQSILTGRTRAEQYADIIGSVYNRGKQHNDMDWAKKEIEKRLLKPLGVVKNR
ncbi:MAG: hypothetical protein JRH18_04990 [Deltaproteobacteria bacterium]|nr:hypothetical protein [Deltaproteobacteria bacterium]MBW2151001.1 hypothetical protein [Deltaproteobacteria bacterium]